MSVSSTLLLIFFSYTVSLLSVHRLCHTSLVLRSTVNISVDFSLRLSSSSYIRLDQGLASGAFQPMQ